jgi:hypothetical protein
MATGAVLAAILRDAAQARGPQDDGLRVLKLE